MSHSETGHLSEVFIADGFRRKAAWALAVVAPCAAALWAMTAIRGVGHPVVETIGLIGALAMLGTGFVWAIGVARRNRPVVEVSDRRIEYGSPFGLATRRTLATGDVAAVRRTGNWLILTTREGGLEKIDVSDLSDETAQQVAASIGRRIGASDQRPA